METLLGLLVMLSCPAWLYVQYRALRDWEGRWWTAAVLPLVVMVPLLVLAVSLFAAGSNLWPLLPILASPLALGWLVAVAIGRAIAG